MSTASRPGRIAVCLLVAVGLVMPLSGCSSVGKMTCSEFNELDVNEKSSKLRSLLREHDLEPDSMGNTVGVIAAVESFCSSSSHDDSPLDDAVDWDSPTW